MKLKCVGDDFQWNLSILEFLLYTNKKEKNRGKTTFVWGITHICGFNLSLGLWVSLPKFVGFVAWVHRWVCRLGSLTGFVGSSLGLLPGFANWVCAWSLASYGFYFDLLFVFVFLLLLLLLFFIFLLFFFQRETRKKKKRLRFFGFLLWNSSV